MDIFIIIETIKDQVAKAVKGVNTDPKLTGDIVIKLNVNQGGIRWTEINLEKIKLNNN